MTREEAKELLLHILMTYEPKDQYGDYNDPEPYEQALTMAIEALSAEAVQGEWIKHKGEWIDFDFYPTKYECNQCHYYVDEGYDSIYCPNCGAKMVANIT